MNPALPSSPGAVVVYGASGHTGRFVAAELVRRGLPLVLSGRDARKLDELAARWPGAAVRPAAVDDRAALDRAFAGAAAVINCAGPFLDTANAVGSAALDAGAHYLDVAAEQASAAHSFEAFDERARRRGLSVLPAAAFYGGLADLLASAAMGERPRADRIEIGIALDSWHPTAGTRITGQRNTAARLNIAGGSLAALPQPAPTRRWTFAAPFGEQAMVELPFSEIVTIARHLKTDEARTYLNQSSLGDLRDPKTPPPQVDAHTGRSAQQFRVEVRVQREGEVRHAAASGHDIYAVSAPIIVEAASRLVSGRDNSLAGAFALGQRFDARDFLRALAPQHLQLELPGAA